MTQFEVPYWYDLHAHFRQGAMTKPILADHAAMGCAGILAMPNTKPPVTCVFERDAGDNWSIEGYRRFLMESGADVFDRVIVPLYLSRDTTPQMIEAGAKAGVLQAAKYYPPHGTTGADHGQAMDYYLNNGVIQALSDNGVTLLMHGEAHGLAPEQYFDRAGNAEEIFYREYVTRLIDAFPKLRMVGEHITTKVAADIIESAPAHVGATITPQHLLYTVGHLLQGCKYHLYCLPLPKYVEDRDALRRVVLKADNTKFFAGTDSAPHTTKVTPCGCAAGCYTGAIAPALYAMGFEDAGCSLDSAQGQAAFIQFLSLNGQRFYDLPEQTRQFVMTRKAWMPQVLHTPDGDITPITIGMFGDAGHVAWQVSLAD